MSHVHNLQTFNERLIKNESVIVQQKETFAQRRIQQTKNNDIQKLDEKVISLEREKYNIQNSFSSRMEHAMNVRSKIIQQINDNNENIIRLKNTPSQNSITKAINKKQNEKYEKLKKAQSKNKLAAQKLEDKNKNLQSKLASLDKLDQMIATHSKLSEQIKQAKKQYTQQYKSSIGNPSEYYLLKKIFKTNTLEDIEKWANAASDDLEVEYYDDTLLKTRKDELISKGYITLNDNRVTLTKEGQHLFKQASIPLREARKEEKLGLK